MYYENKFERLCFACKKSSIGNSRRCAFCGEDAAVPISHVEISSSKFKLCKSCNKLNQGNRSLCAYCGKPTLRKLPASPQPSQSEKLHISGIGYFKSGKYEEAVKCFEKAGYELKNEWSLMALAECFFYGLGTEADVKRACSALERCSSIPKDRRRAYFRRLCERSSKLETISVTPKKQQDSSDTVRNNKIVIPVEAAVSCALTLDEHPVPKESPAVKNAYFAELKNVISKIGIKNEYSKKYIEFYKRELGCVGRSNNIKVRIPNKLNFALYLDVMAVFGFDPEYIGKNTFDKIKKLSALKPSKSDEEIFERIYSCPGNCDKYWDKLISKHKSHGAWLELMKKNFDFVRVPPCKIMMTATISAGKSSFINALCGVNIAKTQNIACTGRLHCIYGKPFDDGVVSKWEGKQLLTYDTVRSALSDNESELHETSYESVYFRGGLSGSRIQLIDTPGVNSSEDPIHRQITEEAVASVDINCLIYVINAQYIGTDDDAAYLRFIRDNIGDRRILFVLNKLDSFREEDDVFQSIENTRTMLVNIGFKEPAVCPLSAYAAIIANELIYEKRELTRAERNNVYNLMDKFESRSYDLSEYYEKNFGISIPVQPSDEEELLRRCGMMYIIKIIKNMVTIQTP